VHTTSAATVHVDVMTLPQRLDSIGDLARRTQVSALCIEQLHDPVTAPVWIERYGEYVDSESNSFQRYRSQPGSVVRNRTC
jgi:hypothetical protein